MTQHSLITGPDNHEPKGVESASINTVYVANGAGSGTWKNTETKDVGVTDTNSVISSSNLDGALYELYQGSYISNGVFTDVASSETLLVPIPWNCQITSIKMILAGPITTANSTITVTRSDGAAMGSQVISFSGSAEGTTFVFTPSGNSTFTNHNYVKLVSDGGASGVSKMYVQVIFKRT